MFVRNKQVNTKYIVNNIKSVNENKLISIEINSVFDIEVVCFLHDFI